MFYIIFGAKARQDTSSHKHAQIFQYWQKTSSLWTNINHIFFAMSWYWKGKGESVLHNCYTARVQGTQLLTLTAVFVHCLEQPAPDDANLLCHYKQPRWHALTAVF